MFETNITTSLPFKEKECDEYFCLLICKKKPPLILNCLFLLFEALYQEAGQVVYFCYTFK